MVSPIVIGGPTGSGKSEYAIRLAQEISGEIICADSRQVYSGMKIGSASPTEEECALVPHHNYNFVDPSHDYDAGNFIEDTDKKVKEILLRGNVPIIVGGTGMYLRSWHYGLTDVPGKNDEIRMSLKEKLEVDGLGALFAELEKVDEETAKWVGANDEFRIVRALEIFKMTGKKASDLRKSHLKKPRQTAEWRLIAPQRKLLNERIYLRTKNMFANGIIDEAVKLRSTVSPANKLLQTIGYKECLEYVDGRHGLEQAIELTFIRTRQYAKRQMNWFAKEDYWNPI